MDSDLGLEISAASWSEYDAQWNRELAREFTARCCDNTGQFALAGDELIGQGMGLANGEDENAGIAVLEVLVQDFGGRSESSLRAVAVKALLAMGRVYLRSGRRPAGVQCLMRVLERYWDPGNVDLAPLLAEALHRLACFHAQTGCGSEALEYVTKLTDEPNLLCTLEKEAVGNAFGIQAALLAARHDVSACISCFRAAVEGFPQTEPSTTSRSVVSQTLDSVVPVLSTLQGVPEVVEAIGKGVLEIACRDDSGCSLEELIPLQETLVESSDDTEVCRCALAHAEECLNQSRDLWVAIPEAVPSDAVFRLGKMALSALGQGEEYDAWLLENLGEKLIGALQDAQRQKTGRPLNCGSVQHVFFEGLWQGLVSVANRVLVPGPLESVANVQELGHRLAPGPLFRITFDWDCADMNVPVSAYFSHASAQALLEGTSDADPSKVLKHGLRAIRMCLRTELASRVCKLVICTPRKLDVLDSVPADDLNHLSGCALYVAELEVEGGALLRMGIEFPGQLERECLAPAAYKELDAFGLEDSVLDELGAEAEPSEEGARDDESEGTVADLAPGSRDDEYPPLVKALQDLGVDEPSDQPIREEAVEVYLCAVKGCRKTLAAAKSEVVWRQKAGLLSVEETEPLLVRLTEHFAEQASISGETEERIGSSFSDMQGAVDEVRMAPWPLEEIDGMEVVCAALINKYVDDPQGLQDITWALRNHAMELLGGETEARGLVMLETIPHVLEAAESRPQDRLLAQVLVDLGRTYKGLERRNDAITCCRRVISTWGNQAEASCDGLVASAFYELGDLFANEGDDHRALACFMKLRDNRYLSGAGWHSAWSGLGEAAALLSKGGKIQQALDRLNEMHKVFSMPEHSGDERGAPGLRTLRKRLQRSCQASVVVSIAGRAAELFSDFANPIDQEEVAELYLAHAQAALDLERHEEAFRNADKVAVLCAEDGSYRMLKKAQAAEKIAKTALEAMGRGDQFSMWQNKRFPVPIAEQLAGFDETAVWLYDMLDDVFD